MNFTEEKESVVTQNESHGKPIQYQTADYFNLTNYTGCTVSYDNKSVLVSSDKSGCYNLYQYSLDGLQVTQLTHSNTDSIIAVSWFPNDSRLLYTCDSAGNELNHIFVMTPQRQTVDLTPGRRLKSKFVSWQRDASGFFVLTNERDSRVFDLYRYASDDYQRQLIFENKECWTMELVSPDGNWLALRKIHSNASSDIYLVKLNSIDKKPFLVTGHSNTVQHRSYTFTPDSKQLIYSTDEYSEFRQVWSINLTDFTKAFCYKKPWDIVSVSFSDDGQYCIYYINQDGRHVADIIEVATARKINLPISSGNIKDAILTSDNLKLVFYYYSDTCSAALYTYQLSDGKLTCLIDKKEFLIQQQDLVQSEVIRFKSFDGLTIPGHLFKPRSASTNSKVPVLIWIHGGPGGQFRQGYKADIQSLLNKGYAILGINNRGSSGYGKTFFHLDDKKHGDHDLKDIVHAKRHIQNISWIDETKIGVIGNSYGGYLTMAAMTFTGEFQVGIDIFGVTNWPRTLNSMPSWWAPIKKALFDEMGDPATDSARHKAISPLFHANKISKPVLVVQGANDPRVLQIESDEMVAEIRKNNIPVEYLLFPDEGHGFNKRCNQISAANAYIEFLKKYL
jgi:prolyl oligopeptidase